MRNGLHFVAAFCTLVIGVSRARAQAVSSADSTRGYWLGASLGAAAIPPAVHGPGAAAGTIALDVQRGVRSVRAGLGLTGYLDLNTARSFGGFGLELTLGQWR